MILDVSWQCPIAQSDPTHPNPLAAVTYSTLPIDFHCLQVPPCLELFNLEWRFPPNMRDCVIHGDQNCGTVTG